MQIGKYSFGIGDRFSQQGEAQLQAFIDAADKGIEITPVWNKSNREHLIIGSTPGDTLNEAINAVTRMKWTGPWFVDADHINSSNVDNFISTSNFFTIDVADYISRKAPVSEIEKFVDNNRKFTGKFSIPGIPDPFTLNEEMIYSIGGKFSYAIAEAAKIYRHIESIKGVGNFVTEISMDEVIESQSPLELFFILGALANENVPVQTIAPKFSGRFNKGVDYQGDLKQFEKEFEQDLLVTDMAVKEFDLPANLKLSIHSGSDKFSIYPLMGHLIRKYDKGIHIKTAGTTWLEEMIGLALSGGDALYLAKDIYSKGLSRFDELCGPYSSVIDINRKKLPSAPEVSEWTGEKFANALRNEPGHPEFNPDMRQLIHVAYKIAAESGAVYIDLVKSNKAIIGKQVTENIYKRHFGRIFNL